LSPNLDRHVVTAVLVAHDGARWLPETLKAVLTQSRPVQRLVAVDTGSRDRGPAVLSEVVGDGNLLRLPRTTGYGEAVAEALRHPAAVLPMADGDSAGPRVEWVWLLHDDCAPAHDALDHLLTAAETDPNNTVLGPKLRDWSDRRVLLEAGVSIDRAGRRWTGIEDGELDQGQHDGVRDVLAVSTAGMLIRRDVWDDLGGLDLNFGLFRDDLDLGWRAHARGHRVVAVTDAIAYHAEASARGLRETGVTSEHGRRRDRRNAMYVLLANLPPAAMARAACRNVVGTLVRALFLVLVKQPAAARDALGALGDVLRDPGRLRRARAMRAHHRKRVHRSVKRFQPRRVALRRLIEHMATLLSPDSSGRHGAEEAEPGSGEPSLRRRLLGHPGVVVTAALIGLAVIAERSALTAGGRLGGGALVPSWGGASDLWSQYIAGWHPVGLGSDSGSPPYVGVMAFLSTVLFGKPWLAVMVVMLGCVPVAGLTGYIAARAVVTDAPTGGRRAMLARRRIPAGAVRAWFAVTYALLPAATGAVAGGRLGTVVVIMLLPLIGLLVARMFGLPRAARASRRSRPRGTRGRMAVPGPRGQAVGGPVARARAARRAAWGVALLLTVAMAFVPLVWVLILIVGVLAWVAFGSAGRGLDRNLLIALGVPPLLLFPWTAGLLVHPSRFLLEAGLHRSELVDARLSGVSLLALDPGGPGTPALWTTIGLLAIAVLALPLRSRRISVLSGWTLALFGLLTAILVSAITVTKGADRAPAWPGPALTFAAAGVLLAATAAVQRAVEVLAGRHLTYRLGGALVILAGLTAPLLAAGSWAAGGTGPLGEVTTEAVPALTSTDFGPRTLVLSQDRHGRVSYSVVRGVEPMLGDPELETSEAARRRMDRIVAGIASSRDQGDARILTRMGIQHIMVPRPLGDPLTRVLDAAPELTRLGRTDRFGLWRVLAPGGRLMLVDGPEITALPVGATSARVRIPAGNAGRTVLLAEPAGGWHATFNGAEAKAKVVDGWAQAYDVPAGGGEFRLSHGMLLRRLWVGAQALAFLIVVVLALPGGQIQEGAAAERDRRRSRGRRARATGDAAVPAVPRPRAPEESGHEESGHADENGHAGDGRPRPPGDAEAAEVPRGPDAEPVSSPGDEDSLTGETRERADVTVASRITGASDPAPAPHEPAPDRAPLAWEPAKPRGLGAGRNGMGPAGMDPPAAEPPADHGLVSRLGDREDHGPAAGRAERPERDGQDDRAGSGGRAEPRGWPRLGDWFEDAGPRGRHGPVAEPAPGRPEPAGPPRPAERSAPAGPAETSGSGEPVERPGPAGPIGGERVHDDEPAGHRGRTVTGESGEAAEEARP
jgi:GT2 family glycosyltransferase